MAQCKREEEREFYIRLAIREQWGKRELENPAIGLLLCATKDSEVVEYALSRSLSPAMIAEYETQLPNKIVLPSLVYFRNTPLLHFKFGKSKSLIHNI